MDYAVACGDLERVRELIDFDVNIVDGRNSSRDVPLIEAARYWHREIFDLLIRCGAEVNCRAGFNDWTPLHWACFRGWVDQVRLILEKGANLNAAANDGETPLILAVSNGHEEIFNLLIQYGAEVNCGRDYNDWTPLHYVSRKGWVDQVQLVLEKGANLNAAANDGDTPLILAVSNGHRKIFDLLIRCGAEVNCKAGFNGWTPLHYTSSKGWVDQVRLILEKGANLNASANDGETPLILAASNGHRKIFDLLIQYGAEVNCGRDYKNWTPLHWACFRGWVNQVRLILEKGADPNASGQYDGDVPLKVAAGGGHIYIFVLLFQYGATMDCVYALISKHSFLEAVFKDVNLCSQSIVNKFYCHSLPTLYSNPDIAKKLPVFKNFKLKVQQTQQIAKFVETEVETKKLCNVFNSQPIVLMLLCVQSLLSHHSTRKMSPFSDSK